MRDTGGHKGRGLAKTIDWKLVICYLLLVLIGWANIYASVHSSEPASIFDFGTRSGKQFVWIITALVIASINGADYAYCPADGVVADQYENVCRCSDGAVADVIYNKIPEILKIEP